MKRSSEALVKKTLTIPKSLNDKALQKGFNFSQTLSEAIEKKLKNITLNHDIKFEGHVLTDVPEEEFWKEFIDFVEDRGWRFIGMTTEIED